MRNAYENEFISGRSIGYNVGLFLNVRTFGQDEYAALA